MQFFTIRALKYFYPKKIILPWTPKLAEEVLYRWPYQGSDKAKYISQQ